MTVMTPRKLDFSRKRPASAKAKKKRDAVRNKVWDPALMKWNRGHCPKKSICRRAYTHTPGQDGLALWT